MNSYWTVNIQWTKVGFWLSCYSSTDTKRSGQISQTFTDYELLTAPHVTFQLCKKLFHTMKYLTLFVSKSVVSYKGQ